MKDAPLDSRAVLQKNRSYAFNGSARRGSDSSAAEIAKDFVLAKQKLSAILERIDTRADNLAALIELRVYIMNIESEFRQLSDLLEQVIVDS